MNNRYIQHLKKALRTLLYCAELTVVCCFCTMYDGAVYGQSTDLFYNAVSGTEITAGNSFMVTDDRFRDKSWSEIEKTRSVKGHIALEINDDVTIVSKEAFVCQVTVRVDMWNSRDDSTAVVKDLVISFDPTGQSSYDARNEFHFNDAHEFRVSIIDIKMISREDAAKQMAVPPILKISGYLDITRSLNFSCTEQTSIFAGIDNATERLGFSWAAMDEEVKEYDLEWTFYDKESEWGQNVNNPGFTVNYEDIFRNNVTRLITSDLTFELPMVYPDGYIFYRIRGARFDNGLRQTTNWSYSTSSGTLSGFPGIYPWLTAHEQTLNWQTSTTFAEDAKNAQTVNYADGLPRSRQEVSLSRADDLVIAKEVIYDLHGRPAVQVMPAPVIAGGGFNNKLEFISINARNTDDEPYSAKDFDLGDDCSSFDISPMSNASGPALYYSPENPTADFNLSLHRFIPDAQQFPFSVTEFTPDATGRIKRQGGVGPLFSVNGGHSPGPATEDHTTSYYYGKPSQPELDRLFKTGDVGLSAHYQKNMVRDPNGQFSVSYVDPNGRTVATALAGVPPGNVLPLEPAPQLGSINTNLLNNIVRDASITSTYNLLVAESGAYTFNYDLNVSRYTEDCLEDICYDCMYDLNIKVTDNCGSTASLAEINKTNVNLPPLSNTCDPLIPPPGLEEVINLALPPGEYTVSKTLSVSIDAIEYFAAQYQLSECMPDLETITNEFILEADINCEGITCNACHELLAGYILNEQFELYDLMLPECEILCQAEQPETYCEIFLQTLLADVSLGGQYMTLQPAVGEPDFEDCTLPVLSDQASFFYANPANPDNTPIYKHPVYPYKDEDGNDDIIVIDDVEFKPEELDVCDFITYWKPSWAAALVEKHPEYCLYEACRDEDESEEYNIMLLLSENFPNLPFEDYTGVLAHDPYFGANGGGFNNHSEMEIWINEFMTINGVHYSLLDVMVSHIACYNSQTGNNILPCATAFGDLCIADQQTVWEMFRAAYLGRKYEFFTRNIDDATYEECPLASCVGEDFNKSGGNNKSISVPCPSAYTSKLKRWLVRDYFPDGVSIEDLIDTYQQEINDDIVASCDENCDATVEIWMRQLLEMQCIINLNLSQLQKDELQQRLKNICTNGCDATHPFGSTNIDPDNSLPAGEPTSVREAIFQLTGLPLDDCDALCTDLYITFPGSFEQQQRIGGPQPVYRKDFSCVCKLYASFKSCWDNNQPNPVLGQSTFLDYFNYFSDVKVTQAQLDEIGNTCASTNTCKTIQADLVIPPQLACDICVRAPVVKEKNDEFILMCGAGADDLRAAYLNRVLGLNYEAAEYDKFLMDYGSLPTSKCSSAMVLCPRSQVAPLPPQNCYEEQIEILTTAALDAYNEQVAYLVDQFKKRYLAHCINQMEMTETFSTDAGIREQQYTLYYYDRAGHLVQTVPPNGVTLGDLTHTFVTTYRYDCFGNPVERRTPDGGLTQTWYDYIGRPVVSQDARQANPAQGNPILYSYTIYDGLGRPVETGEKEQIGTNAMDNTIARDKNLLANWINQDASIAIRDMTRTYYDDTPMDWAAIHQPVTQPSMVNYAPQNLRKRVAAVVFFEAYEPPLNPGQTLNGVFYEYATHYSYDIVGNVKTLVQDIRRLGSSGTNRYKRIEYNYDIISGKVNQVDYQAGAVDHFIHRYTYDANNRLTMVETGTTGEEGSWEVDADYEYYAHGPLGRTVLGERKVQGVDYAYTLQGWVKGVNASAMNAFSDDSDIPEFLYIHDEDIPTGEYRARTAIISHGRVRAGSNVKFFAGKYISLEETGPGFRADLGSEFLAMIEPALDNDDPGDIVDMGRDGAVQNGRLDIARDAFSYTIGYYNQDYMKISNPATTPEFEISHNYGGFYTAAPDLFNGNIRHIAQQVKTLTASGFNYQYDQLNRLRTMDYWNTTGGVWGTSGAYQEMVTYDPNGNIQTYDRNAANQDGVMESMDHLIYNYDDPGTNSVINNRLNFVSDNVNPAAFPNDIDQQPDGNYTYDAAGNLIADATGATDGARTFEWSMYGKLKVVDGLPDDGSIIYGYDAMQKRVMKINRRIITDDGPPPISVVQETRTFYIRDAQGNTLATYEQSNTNKLTLKELELYGTARLGVFRAEKLMYNNLQGNNEDPIGTAYLGRKEYELSNHLGNVMAVVRDEFDEVDFDDDGDFDYREPRVASAQEYYPFGLPMPNRKSPAFANTIYRYTFNGKESDDDAGYGDDGFQDYGMRMYMPGLGRFMTLDPIASNFPWWSPYAFAGNTPIMAIDLDGMEMFIPQITIPIPLEPMGPILTIPRIPMPTMPMPPGEIMMPPLSPSIPTIPNEVTVGQPTMEMEENPPIDWANDPPSSPQDLGSDWENVTDPRNKSGSEDYKNKDSGEEIRWDPGKSDKSGWEGKDHWHRENPNSSNRLDRYLDKNGNPVPKGSDASHIEAPKVPNIILPEMIIKGKKKGFFEKMWDGVKDFFTPDPPRIEDSPWYTINYYDKRIQIAVAS